MRVVSVPVLTLLHETLLGKHGCCYAFETGDELKLLPKREKCTKKFAKRMLIFKLLLGERAYLTMSGSVSTTPSRMAIDVVDTDFWHASSSRR